jgi:HSP20 family molecular chaperone IbpA
MMGGQAIVDIVEGEDALLFRIALGDVCPEDVTIAATDRVLFVRGGDFSRSFYLPGDVEGAAALAIMSDGVLTVRIPRRDAMFAA